MNQSVKGNASVTSHGRTVTALFAIVTGHLRDQTHLEWQDNYAGNFFQRTVYLRESVTYSMPSFSSALKIRSAAFSWGLCCSSLGSVVCSDLIGASCS